ncbi:nuclear export mediator factor NEMF [Chelonus insularis]|uniref:nuclear export mediator factor NEMF n=1 Tax=Chelonus insularis TaxID=460826 RepID=UPI00158C3123|nr:nuclear export mediator factor NEMF [Chelonus insularis]
MKTRFDTYDLVCSIAGLQRLIGMRVNQVYDIDHRTYLIRFQRSEEKCILLLESGNRMHTTAFEWPKNTAPSGFSMKMRKHLKNKRLESLTQIGTDRVVDLKFGSDEAAYHVILEVYDRGNIILTDYQLTILNILRPHTEGDKIRLAVREKYPVDRVHTTTMPPRKVIESRLAEAKSGESLKKFLNPLLEFGSALIDHVLLKSGFPSNCKIEKTFNVKEDMDKLWSALQLADQILEDAKKGPSKGYIFQKKESKPSQDGKDEFMMVNIGFHPELLEQCKNQHYKEFDNFDAAVDEYFSTMEGQKLDFKALAQEREALKKLENVRKDHDQRLAGLGKVQEEDKKKAELISRNQALVDNAILVVQSALAAQMPWPEIEELIKEAQMRNDPIALAIKKLKFETNHISLYLTDPYESVSECSSDENNEENQDNVIADKKDNAKKNIRDVPQFSISYQKKNDDEKKKDDNKLKSHNQIQKNVFKKGKKNVFMPEEPLDDKDDGRLKPMIVDIDLELTAFANATKYYNMKRSAAKKHQKTIESHEKALKNAEKKTKQTLKEVQAIHSINKARKVYWFEKFYWFITSENYLVIGGRDQQQNELIVKRYLRPGDLYVHADLTGASSVVLKNPSGNPVPPKSLSEAGTMAVAYSIAWDAKVVARAYWVHHDQVSKTAPTGEYLTTGSFMIRGRKNYLPPCQLVMGLGFLFRLEESSIERHQSERKIKTLEEDKFYVFKEESADEEELKVPEDDSDNSDNEGKLEAIEENEKVDDINDNKEDSKSSSDEEGDQVKFPDTQIKLDLSGAQMKFSVDPKSSLKIHQSDEEIIYLGDDQPVILKPSLKKKPNQGKVSVTIEEQLKTQESKGNSERTKRRQKTKQKKMMNKYKDQDEEDRQIIMEMMKPNPAREARKMKKNKKTDHTNQARKKNRNISNQYDTQRQSNNVENIDDDADPGPAPEVDMLNQLTGKPVEEDELLFAVPVVAPYNAVLNYKFKVKLTPGTGRRGKAAKTALDAFLRDKIITQREKDLLKAVKEETVARNIPGKVKITTPAATKSKS